MKLAVVGLMGNKKSFPQSQLDARKKQYEKYVAKETQIDVVLPEEGTYWVDRPTEFDLIYITPFIVKRIVEAEKEGYDACLVDCIFDPGVDEARCVVNIPVVGPGRIVLHTASVIADKAGFFCPAGMSAHIYRFARRYGISDIVHYVEAVEYGPTIFAEKKNAIHDMFVEFGHRAIKAGAQVLVPWALPLVFAGGLDTREVSKTLGIPVIDPHIYAKVAEDLVEMGLKNSRQAYPSPPQKQVDFLLDSMTSLAMK